MGAPKGNQFWKVRTKHGRDKVFATADILWEAACEYFEWVEENPLYETKAFSFQGMVTTEEIPKMRAMTMEGLCIFLGVNTKYFSQFESTIDLETKEGKDFSNVIGNVKEIIRNQKFVGAAADLLNANIIARDLGLKDQAAHEVTGANGGPVQMAQITKEMSDKEATDIYLAMMRGNADK